MMYPAVLTGYLVAIPLIAIVKDRIWPASRPLPLPAALGRE